MNSPAERAPAEASSHIDRSVLTIREMILKGDFRPGQRISELPLSARLNVSRTPLRLALDRLCHEGLLQPWPTGGFVVREFTLADIWDAIEVRGVLEGTAARFAAERLSNVNEAAALRECCKRIDDIVPVTAARFSAYLELNDNYHSELKRLSKSAMLIEALDRICTFPFAAPGALVLGGAELAHMEVSEVAQEHHRAIVEAIENREGTRAESVAREHSRLARKNLAWALQDKELLGSMPGASLIRMPQTL